MLNQAICTASLALITSATPGNKVLCQKPWTNEAEVAFETCMTKLRIEARHGFVRRLIVEASGQNADIRVYMGSFLDAGPKNLSMLGPEADVPRLPASR